MSRETRVPAIPEVRQDNILDVLRAVKSTLEVREGYIGDSLDQGVTFRDLTDLNLASTAGGYGITGTNVPVIPVLPPPVNGYNPATDYTTPPAPTGLRAKGGSTAVYLEWDGAPYKNHAYAEIWRSSVDNLGTAVRVGTTAASVYADPAEPDSTYFYWIRFVSVANITGPYNQTSGTQATTALDVSKALAIITSDIRSSQLYVDLGTRIGQVEESTLLNSSQLDVLKDAAQMLEALVSTNGSAILNTQKVNRDQATSITSLKTRVGTAESNITLLNTTTSNQATSISQLSSTVDGHTTSIQTIQTTTNGLSGQYTVKIDNNGHVSGFGLASTTTTSGPTSAFIVRADRFAIAGPGDTSNPLGTINPTKMPFVVLTSTTTINGKSYPAGTWMDSAFIANATIGSAQIADLTADKITTGSLTAAIGISTGKIYGGVNINNAFGASNFGTGFFLGLDSSVYKLYVGSYSQNMKWDGTNLSVTGNINATSGTFRNITVYDGNNNVILSSAGVNASLLSIANSQVTGLGSLATQDSVFIGSTVKIYNGVSYQTLNTSDFVNSLSKITSSNVSTFIASAAIGDAYIGNLSAAKITTGYMAADRIGAGSIQVGQYLQSSNYVAGSSGWKIDGSGNTEMNSLTVRSGQVTGALLKIAQMPHAYGVGLHFDWWNNDAPNGNITGGSTGYSYVSYANTYWAVLWVGTMPAPETAAHKIAGLVTVSATNNSGSTSKDLVVVVLANVGISGTTMTGDQLGYGVQSGPYNFTVATAGATSATYGTAVSLAILVGGFNVNDTINSSDGFFWGVR